MNNFFGLGKKQAQPQPNYEAKYSDLSQKYLTLNQAYHELQSAYSKLDFTQEKERKEHEEIVIQLQNTNDQLNSSLQMMQNKFNESYNELALANQQLYEENTRMKESGGSNNSLPNSNNPANPQEIQILHEQAEWLHNQLMEMKEQNEKLSSELQKELGNKEQLVEEVQELKGHVWAAQQKQRYSKEAKMESISINSQISSPFSYPMKSVYANQPEDKPLDYKALYEKCLMENDDLKRKVSNLEKEKEEIIKQQKERESSDEKIDFKYLFERLSKEYEESAHKFQEFQRDYDLMMQENQELKAKISAKSNENENLPKDDDSKPISNNNLLELDDNEIPDIIPKPADQEAKTTEIPDSLSKILDGFEEVSNENPQQILEDQSHPQENNVEPPNFEYQPQNPQIPEKNATIFMSGIPKSPDFSPEALHAILEYFGEISNFQIDDDPHEEAAFYAICKYKSAESALRAQGEIEQLRISGGLEGEYKWLAEAVTWVK